MFNHVRCSCATQLAPTISIYLRFKHLFDILRQKPLNMDDLFAAFDQEPATCANGVQDSAEKGQRCSTNPVNRDSRKSTSQGDN